MNESASQQSSLTNPSINNVVIIGAGPAGYTAAIYAARANLNPILVCGYEKGGQLTLTSEVSNYPGFAHPITGMWLMDQMEEQAKSVGAIIVDDQVTSVDLSAPPYKINLEIGEQYLTKCVIICTGAQAKWLELPSEKKFRGYGVSGCAICDGPLFHNKYVMVVGGGNVAVGDALYLTKHAKHVTLIHRRNSFRAEKMLQNQVMRHPNITTLWNRTLEEVIGDENTLNVHGARIKNVIDGTEETINVDGIFIAIGHTPHTALFKGQIDIDSEGYIITAQGGTATNKPGVYAAGDVQDKIFRQAITAAGTGCMAALEAAQYLSTHYE